MNVDECYRVQSSDGKKKAWIVRYQTEPTTYKLFRAGPPGKLPRGTEGSLDILKRQADWWVNGRVAKLLHTADLDVKKFFSKLVPGDIFVYSDAYMHDEVVALARKYGKAIEYFTPGTVEYKAYGCYTCGVTEEILNAEQREEMRKSIHAAYRFLRENNHNISDEVLDFIKDAALEKLEIL
jgi:hypothetical protein